jgi:SecD/SecF fusion protein
MFDSMLSGCHFLADSGLSGYSLVGLLVVAVLLGLLLAHFLGGSLSLTDYRKRMAWVFVPFLVALLMIATGWPPEFGVDLRGGINMVGSLNLADEDAEEFGPDYVRPKAKDIIPILIGRVNPSGTKEIMIRALGDEQIEVTIPSVSLEEAEGVWDSIVKTGKLEFRIVANRRFPEHEAVFRLANEASSSSDFRKKRSKFVVDTNDNRIGVWVGLAKVLPTAEEMAKGDLPETMPFKFSPDGSHLIRNKSTGNIAPLNTLQYSNNPKLRGLEFAEWCRDNGITKPEILMLYPVESQDVQGKHLASVTSTYDSEGKPAVAFRTTGEGMGRLGLLTKLNSPDPNNGKKELGIVIDGNLHSAPTINSTIRDSGEISGSFTQREVNELKTNLNSGKLSVALNKNPISRNFVESTLGQELRDKGIWAIGASLVLVLVFMVIYYGFAGIVATISLILNLLLILALVMMIKQPLTLTGLAGLVLTVGMSVDANVLIFERIREELDRGSALRMAIRNGFDKATVTIVDANLTTLITALILYVFGTEQVKGFSVTLILGILMSMYTAIYCSRLMFDVAERKGWLTKLSMRRILDKGSWDFLSKVSLTSVLSIVLIGVGLGSVFLLGPKILDHDLRGGSTVRMVFKEPQNIEDIRAKLNSQEVIAKGEKAEFTVSGFSGVGTEPEMANRVFKVDSNLPAWEGESDGERWDQLDEVMTRVFEGELEMHSATVSGTDNQSSQSPTNAPNEQSNSRPLSPGSFHDVKSTILSALLPTMLLQADAATDGETITEEPVIDAAQNESVETATPDTSMPATEMADAELSPPSDEDSPTSDAAAEPIEGGSDLPDADPADINPNDFVTGDSDDQNVLTPTNDSAEMDSQLSASVTREMNFEQPISGKTLKELLIQASVSIDRAIDEENIKVDSPDTEPGESSAGTMSKTWTTEFTNIAPIDVDDVVSKWSEDFNSRPYFPTSSKVGGQIAKKMQGQALFAVVLSLLAIILYVWFRFQNLAFGLAAVIALIHDVAIVLGAIAISHYLSGGLGFLGIDSFKISLEVVAALLTVIGYSLNDTIVVFDRIREVRGKRKDITAEIINTSISQTLSRTILTSLTTFIVVFILYCFGGDAIHGFAFALTVGVIVGTYSSIFIASPALLWLMNTVGLNPMEVEPETTT